MTFDTGAEMEYGAKLLKTKNRARGRACLSTGLAIAVRSKMDTTSTETVSSICRTILSILLVLLLSSCSIEQDTYTPSSDGLTMTPEQIKIIRTLTPAPSNQQLRWTGIPTSSVTPILTLSPAKSTTTAPDLLSSDVSSSGWLAFVSNYDTVDIVHTNGKGRRSIVEGVLFPEDLAWSPDGQSIAFTGLPSRNSGSQIYLARPDGSKTRRLTYTTGYKMCPAWSPDGKSIVYRQVSEGVDIFVYDLDASRIRQLTNTPDQIESCPEFSIDGQMIQFGILLA
jgi:dipeptidyl aminopeptidase/acylaminoacyl peptidase